LRLNLIHGNRSERLQTLKEQLRSNNVTDYEFWEGVYRPSIKASINEAHKQIVMYAKIAGWKEVCIAEDDLIFTSPKSWEYFLDNKPKDYDLYLSMIYLGEPDENNEVKDFTGLTMYCVHERFYDTFLNTPYDDHLDRLLSKTEGKFVVCNPFVAKQTNGFSSNTGKMENYDQLLINRRFL
jgi:hypothetical protein